METTLPISTRTLSGWRAWLQDWSELCKLRLTSLVLLTTLVGLYCGSAGRLEPWRTFFTLLGTVLVAAAAALALSSLSCLSLAICSRTTNGGVPYLPSVQL